MLWLVALALVERFCERGPRVVLVHPVYLALTKVIGERIEADS